MQSNLSIKEKEIEIATELFANQYLPGPIKYCCGEEIFRIYKDIYNQTSLCSFRCINTNWRRKYPIRINSFYSLFPQIILRILSELMSCFLTKEINLEKASNYILNEFNYKISNRVIIKYILKLEIKSIIT